MSTEHLPTVGTTGYRFSSAIRKHAPAAQPARAGGLLLRGVVVATYVTDDPDHPYASNSETPPSAIYCDVLTYGSNPGARWQLVGRCLVLQPRGGAHDGRVWRPRAAGKDFTGPENFNLDAGSNPAAWDGDHVLVGFLDDSFAQPVILGGIPHPSTDVGRQPTDVRPRLHLRVTDGDPDFVLHHGVLSGVTTDGDWQVDTRFANDGQTDDLGREPDPPTDGHGAQTFLLPLEAEASVVLHDMSTPTAPQEKVRVTVAKDRTRVEYVDSGLLLLVDDASGLIELGAEGAAYKAVLESLVKAELDDIRQRLTNLATDLDKHRHPIDLQMLPLIPNPGKPYAACVKNGYLVDPTTQQEPEKSNAPKDKDAELPDYNPVLFPGGGSTGDIASKRVTLDK